MLSSFQGVPTVIVLDEILNLVATFNCFMQRKTTDFSRLKVILDSTLEQLKSLKDDGAEWCSVVARRGHGAEWCSVVASTVENLESQYEITVGKTVGVARRGHTSVPTTLESFRKAVLIPYVDKLVENIETRFSDEGVALTIAMSIFNPAGIPQIDDPKFRAYGTEEIKQLAAFYGEEAEVEFQNETFRFPPIIDRDALLSEWPIFKRALHHEKEALMSSQKLTRSPSFQKKI